MNNSSAPWWPFALRFIVQIIVAQQIIFLTSNSTVVGIDGQKHTTAERSTSDGNFATASIIINTSSVTSALPAAPTTTTIAQRNETDSDTNIERESINVLGTAAALRSNDGGHLGAASRCTLAEYSCTNGKCVPANKFCDKINDCGDNSDEPRFCSRCNRTYYGNLGTTYDLDVLRPKDDRYPFTCELNFTAAGGVHGDIIQITIDGFAIGRFCSYVMDGCPDGYLQISEAARTSVGGMWCGSIENGPVVFYSETRTLILTLKVQRLPRGQSGYNFDFRISYRVLPRENAIVRFGGGDNTNTDANEEQNPWLTTTRYGNSGSNSSTRRNQFNNKNNNNNNDNRNNNYNYNYDNRNNNNFNDNQFNKAKHDEYDYSSSHHESGGSGSGRGTGSGGTASNINRNTSKQSKGSKQSSASWPSHSNKEINSYYGNRTEPKYYLGTLISGTHCSRIFSDCDKKACRLQSPNYPGVYPRNLTCYYAVRQHDVPPGKHALITVKQPKGNLLWIQTPKNVPGANKRKNTENEKFVPHLTTWDECDIIQDYITIFDGYTTRDPVILKFCGGGGDGLPAAISSGPELLVEFVTSPFGTFTSSPVQSRTLNGFQLEIEVQFVDTQSFLYAKNKQLCEFWLRGTGHGELESPRHSLPPNTTCLYHLQGTDTVYRPYDQFHSPRRTGIILPQVSRFKVWISVLKFDLSPKFGNSEDSGSGPGGVTIIGHGSSNSGNSNIGNPMNATPKIGNGGGGGGYHEPNEECNGMLRIWDGPLREVPVCNDLNCERDSKLVTKYGQNLTSVIARYCYGRVPKSCDHGVLNESLARPCTVLESYVSSNDYVTLELRNIESTVLQPVKFKLRYEFIDYQQDGTPINSEHECHRKFVSTELERRDMGKFRSVRNIFMFGRGGSNDLHCVYRFEAERDERIRITIKKVVTSNRQCLSRVDSDTKRSYCFGDSRSKLLIMEQSTANPILFQRGCGCNSSNTSDLPIIYTSSNRVLEIHFSAVNMTALDDPDHLNFEATYEFMKLPLLCKEVKKLRGTSGTVHAGEDNKECRTRQWIIEPTDDRYLYVRMNGAYLRKHELTNLISNLSVKTSYYAQCSTKARFIFTNGEGLSVTACPASENSADSSFVEIFSSGWDTYNQFKEPHPVRSISVEYIDPDDEEDYTFTWFEMVPRVSLGLVAENCAYMCPELDACVNASVWCDGINHCPSGYDESFTHCSALMKLPPEILAGLCVAFILVVCASGAYIYRKIKRRCRGSSILQTRLKSMSSVDTATFDDKDVIS